METKLKPLDSREVEDHWLSLSPFFERALAGCPELLPDHLLLLALSGSVVLWAITQNGTVTGAMATEFVTYPNIKRLRIIALAGNVRLAKKEQFGALKAWALANGAIELEGWVPTNKEGVARLNARLGFTYDYVVMTYDLRRMLQ